VKVFISLLTFLTFILPSSSEVCNLLLLDQFIYTSLMCYPWTRVRGTGILLGTSDVYWRSTTMTLHVFADELNPQPVDNTASV